MEQDEGIRRRDQQLTGLGSSIESLLTEIDTIKGNKTEIDECRAKIRDFNNALDSYKMELRGLESDAQKTIYKQKAKSYSQALNKYKHELDFKSSRMNREELMGGASGDTVGDLSASDAAMKQVLGKQAESKESLSRTLATIGQARDIGKETVTL